MTVNRRHHLTYGPAIITLTTLLLLVSLSRIATASDPELTTDFKVPDGMNASDLDATFFTFTGFRSGVNAQAGTFKPLKAFVDVFPALAGLGIAAALLEFQPRSQNPPHTHPRGTELLYVLDGSVTVGLIDSSNKLYNATLQTGDLFVFPKGLVHFQVNPSDCNKAHALSSFSSSNPGLVSLPMTLFGSNIATPVLTQAFQVDDDIVAKLQSAFKPKTKW